MKEIIHLDDIGFLACKGPDAASFLQGQLTCHLGNITSEQTLLGARCTPQGRVVSIFRLFKFEESYFLRMPRNMVDLTLNSLKKYAMFSKVTLENASDIWGALGCVASNEAISFPKTLNQSVVHGEAVVVNVPGEHRYEIYCHQVKEAELTDILNQVKQKSPLEWRQLNLQAGLPEIYPETMELFTPHDLNLPKLGAVSFNKGCYSGQEIIARMEYRATLKQRLYHLRLPKEEQVNIGDALLYEDKKVGRVVNILEEESQYNVLAVVKDEFIPVL